MIDRYTLSKMGNIWSERHKMEIMLKIEILACEAFCKLGVIPKKSMEKIKKNAKFDIDEVKRLEETMRHDGFMIHRLGNILDEKDRYIRELNNPELPEPPADVPGPQNPPRPKHPREFG